MTRFGQCCLLARRLIEAGVRFVTVNTFLTVFDEITWDIHGSKPFTSIEGMRDIVAPMYDQAYAPARRPDRARPVEQHAGLQPGKNSAARRASIRPADAITGRNAGPSHFAGGGVQGGRVVGRSDAIGGVPAERPVDPAEIVGHDLSQPGARPGNQASRPARTPVPSGRLRQARNQRALLSGEQEGHGNTEGISFVSVALGIPCLAMADLAPKPGLAFGAEAATTVRVHRMRPIPTHA